MSKTKMSPMEWHKQVNDWVEMIYQRDGESEEPVRNRENKRRIVKVTALFGLLTNLMAAYDGFARAFMQSSENRYHFLTNSHLKVKVKGKNRGKICIKEDDPEKYEQYTAPQWLEWQGCQMIIPKCAHIVLSDSCTWPVIYIRSNDKKEETTIKERPWGCEVVTNDEMVLKKTKLLNSGTQAYWTQHMHTTMGSQALNPIKTTQPGKVNEDKEEGVPPKFEEYEVGIPKELNDFQVVVEIPFQATFMDPLTSVRFGKAGKGTVEIQFTLGLT